MRELPTRIVTDSMLGLQMPVVDRWSERVMVVLGLNPGPFTGPGTNTYLVGTGPSRLLLDTGQGVPAYVDVLARSIEESDGVDGLAGIVVTHAHPDHIGGVDAVRARFGALPVSKMPKPDSDRGIDVETVSDRDEVTTEGATLQAVWTPGHARDHLCFYLREERAMFTGDVVLGAGTTVIPRDGDLGDYLASLRRLLEFDMDVIYPAHGPAIHEPHAKIRDYLAHRELRDRQILDALTAAGSATVPEIVRAVYTDVPEFLHGAAGLSVEAHLRKLSEERRVEGEGERWRRR